MEKLLTLEAKALLKKFSLQEGHFKEDAKLKKLRKEDEFYDFFHDRTDSNLNKLICLNGEEFETLKSFLTLSAHTLIEKFSDRQELAYTHIFTVGDVLSTDWVYFPVYRMRREILEHLKNVLDCELNFVLCLSVEQKLALRN